MPHFKLVYMPFPVDLRGNIAGALCQDVRANRYTIYIDSTQPAAAQKQALKHELAHLEAAHLESTQTIEQVEAAADARAESMTDTEMQRLLAWQLPA